MFGLMLYILIKLHTVLIYSHGVKRLGGRGWRGGRGGGWGGSGEGGGGLSCPNPFHPPLNTNYGELPSELYLLYSTSYGVYKTISSIMLK